MHFDHNRLYYRAHHLYITLKRIMIALFLVIISSALILSIIIPLFYLSKFQPIIISAIFIIALLALYIYFIINWHLSVAKQAGFLIMTQLTTLTLPLFSLSQGKRTQFIILSLFWLYLFVLLVLLSVAIPKLIKNYKWIKINEIKM